MIQKRKMTNKDLTKTIKRNLGNIINSSNIKQISKKVNKSEPTIYRYLNIKNNSLPSIETLNRISDIENINITEFFN